MFLKTMHLCTKKFRSLKFERLKKIKMYIQLKEMLKIVEMKHTGEEKTLDQLQRNTTLNHTK